MGYLVIQCALHIEKTTYIQGKNDFEAVAFQTLAAKFGTDRDLEHQSLTRDVVQLQKEGMLEDSFWGMEGYRIDSRGVGVEWEKIVDSEVEPEKKLVPVGPQLSPVLRGQASELICIRMTS